MRARKLKLVITFATTSQAMAMEKMCREEGVPGRLIPLPGAISAGCGLSWCTEPEERENTEKLIKKRSILFENFYEVLI